MSFKNYFKFDFKKPELDEDTKSSHERKQKFLKGIETCESRLETIEICNSNSKTKDALLISKYLSVDIINVLLSFYNQNEISDFNLIKPSLDKIPNAEIISTLEEKLISLDFKLEEEENAGNIESNLLDIIYFIKKNIFSKHGNEIYSPIDDYKSRMKVQIGFILFIFVLISGKLTTEYFKKRPLKSDKLEISYSVLKEILPDDSNKKEFEITTKGEWNTIEMEIPTGEEISVIKIFPGHQDSARFQIKNLKFFDKENKIVYENPLLFHENLMTELSKIMWSENIKPGRITIGKPIEMETTSSHPILFFKFTNPVKSKKLSFDLRIKKKVEKFTD